MILETTTSQSPEEVLAAAKTFFTRRNPIYSAFLEQESPRHVTFRGQGIEEIAIGVAPAESGGTLVRGSTYLFDAQVRRFFTTLAPYSEAERKEVG
ncbi:MAG TPA: hypothetical protein VFK04_10080 [Gemmatimonadaceae bacterium]|jgi:hypothetical protein|nr:hypothetical protein [Gemmatimonadaceae bacterium]